MTTRVQRCLPGAIAFVLGCGTGAGGARDATAPLDATDASPRHDVVPTADTPLDTPADNAVDAPADAATDAPADVATDVAAPTDAPTDAPATAAPAIVAPCTDTTDAVYTTPAGLPALTDATRGDIVHCAVDSTLDMATVQSQLTAKGDVGVTATSGAAIYRVAYRTQRGDGSAAASTARVYVPTAPHAGPLPVVVVGHPSQGLADMCAPSRDAASLQDLALPWAALGYVVIAPDYAGLGNEGTQGYADNRDTAYSVLDGARALRKLITPGAFSAHVLMAGHSQGGGAVLSAQALAGTYGLDGTLSAVVVFAAEWETRLNSFRFMDALHHPSSLTIFYGITTPPVVTSEAFAYDDLYVGAGHGGDAFPTGSRAGMVNAANTLCLTAYGGAQQGLQLHVGDWLEPSLLASLVACDDAPTGAGCVEPGHAFYQHLVNNVLAGDPHGAPVLYVQGLADTIMPPAQEAACNIAKLGTDGVSVQTCTDGPATHTNVTPRNIGFGIQWALAQLAGTTVPTCSSAGLPACTP